MFLRKTSSYICAYPTLLNEVFKSPTFFLGPNQFECLLVVFLSHFFSRSSTPLNRTALLFQLIYPSSRLRPFPLLPLSCQVPDPLPSALAENRLAYHTFLATSLLRFFSTSSNFCVSNLYLGCFHVACHVPLSKSRSPHIVSFVCAIHRTSGTKMTNNCTCYA